MKKLKERPANCVGQRPRGVPERPGGIPPGLNGRSPRSRNNSEHDVSRPSPSPALTGERKTAQPVRFEWAGMRARMSF